MLRMSPVLLTLSIVLVAPCADGQTIPDGPYLGQTPPGTTSEVFAPGIISLPNRYEYSCIFSPDGKEFIFTVTNGTWSEFYLHYTREEDGHWTTPIPAPFTGTSMQGVTPAFSQDGDTVFFASLGVGFQSDLFRVDRTATGWTAPSLLPASINSSSFEFYPSLTEKGDLYFNSARSGGFGQADVYVARYDGGYPTATNVGSVVNGPDADGSVFVDPRDRYIVFESSRPGGYGQSDLYISLHNEDDTWTTPVNLGPAINTANIEDSGRITNDGKYLFFQRRAAFVTSQQTDIHWISTDAFSHLLPQGASNVQDWNAYR